MVILRATKKVLRYLSPPVESPGESDTALGDWYVNRIAVGRQPVLLLASANSLLPILTPARDVRGLPDRLSELVAARLRRLGVDKRLIEAETSAMGEVVVAKTASRSVLGTMTDFAKLFPFYLDLRPGEPSPLEAVEARLADTPCRVTGRVGDSFYPGRKAQELLGRKWAVGDRPEGD